MFNFDLVADENSRSLLNKRAILICLAGSKSYGTNIHSSDTDYRGVMSFGVDDYLSPFEPKEQVIWKNEAVNAEGTIFELKKFIRLACQGNPNVVETLFAEDDRVVLKTEAGQILLANRDLFLTQRLRHSLVGYSVGQLKKIKTQGEPGFLMPANLKDAMHLVRLLKMGEEVLLTGKLNVFRPDAAELLKIRAGLVSYNEIIDFAQDKIKYVDHIIESNQSVLPTDIDAEKIRNLTISLIRSSNSQTY